MALVVTQGSVAAGGWPSGKYSATMCQFNRAGTTTAYTAGDVIMPAAGQIDSGGASAALPFPNVGPSGVVRRATIVHSGETDTMAFRLLLFDAEPTNFADNAALSLVAADRVKLIGTLAFADGDKILIGTTTHLFPATHPADATIPGTAGIPYTSADGKLYGLLHVITGWTPVASTEFTIRLGIEHD